MFIAKGEEVSNFKERASEQERPLLQLDEIVKKMSTQLANTSWSVSNSMRIYLKIFLNHAAIAVTAAADESSCKSSDCCAHLRIPSLKSIKICASP